MIRPHYDICIAWFLGPGKLGPGKATNGFPGSLTYPVLLVDPSKKNKTIRISERFIFTIKPFHQYCGAFLDRFPKRIDFFGTPFLPHAMLDKKLFNFSLLFICPVYLYLCSGTLR